jgi:hypothetical protein
LAQVDLSSHQGAERDSAIDNITPSGNRLQGQIVEKGSECNNLQLLHELENGPKAFTEELHRVDEYVQSDHQADEYILLDSIKYYLSPDWLTPQDCESQILRLLAYLKKIWRMMIHLFLCIGQVMEKWKNGKRIWVRI